MQIKAEAFWKFPCHNSLPVKTLVLWACVHTWGRDEHSVVLNVCLDSDDVVKLSTTHVPSSLFPLSLSLLPPPPLFSPLPFSPPSPFLPPPPFTSSSQWSIFTKEAYTWQGLIPRVLRSGLIWRWRTRMSGEKGVSAWTSLTTGS